jgi:hypothetical protein
MRIGRPQEILDVELPATEVAQLTTAEETASA